MEKVILNSLIFSENMQTMTDMKALTGKSITVFTSSGGNSGNGFTGILIDVREDFIKLMTAIQGATCKCCHKIKRNNIYTHTIIAKEHITAITYNLF